MGGCFGHTFFTVVETVGNFVVDTLDSIFGDSSSSSYTPGAVFSDDHAKKVSDELAEMKEKQRERSQKAEDRIIDYVGKSMSDFINELDKINNMSYDGVVLNLNIKALKKKNDALINSIKGTLADYIDEKIIMTNNELSAILDERDDKKREKSFKAFCRKTQKNAVEMLKAKITKTIKDQEEMISKEIQSRISEVENSANEIQKNLNALQTSKKKNDSSHMTTIFEQMYISELCSILIDDIGRPH